MVSFISIPYFQYQSENTVESGIIATLLNRDVSSLTSFAALNGAAPNEVFERKLEPRLDYFKPPH
jgi:hypothetical protein